MSAPAFTLLGKTEAKERFNRRLAPGERLIVVDGKIWGYAQLYRRLGTNQYQIVPLRSSIPLEGRVFSTVEIPALVEARLADGTLCDPTEHEARQAAEQARREAEAAERKRAEEIVWRKRAEQAVMAFQRGARLEDAILDAMRWARSR